MQFFSLTSSISILNMLLHFIEKDGFIFWFSTAEHSQGWPISVQVSHVDASPKVLTVLGTIEYSFRYIMVSHVFFFLAGDPPEESQGRSSAG